MSERARGQTPHARYHGDSRPVLHPNGQTLPGGCTGDDGRVCRLPQIRGRLFHIDAREAACAGSITRELEEPFLFTLTIDAFYAMSVDQPLQS
jgi:hypothetical protein